MRIVQLIPLRTIRIQRVMWSGRLYAFHWPAYNGAADLSPGQLADLRERVRQRKEAEAADLARIQADARMERDDPAGFARLEAERNAEDDRFWRWR